MKNRILFFLLVCFLGISTMVAQTNMVQHEVKRGETMESIAKQYNVSPEEIKNKTTENAQRLFFLVVPVVIFRVWRIRSREDPRNTSRR